MVRHTAALPPPPARRTALAAVMAMVVASCGGGDGRALPRPADASGERPRASLPRAPMPSADMRACLADLSRAGVSFTPLPDRYEGGGCTAIDSIALGDMGVPVTGLAAMTCPLARGFAAWVRHAVRPAARQMLGSEVVRVETFGSYSCRTVYSQPGARLSEHAFANAVDVSGFVLADGRRVRVKDGWRDPATAPFLRAIHRSACRRFGTVLGPDYNQAHDNHFHLDMGKGGPRGGPGGPVAVFCR